MIKLDKKEQLIRKTVLGQWTKNGITLSSHLIYKSKGDQGIGILIFETKKPKEVLVKTQFRTWPNKNPSLSHIIMVLSQGYWLSKTPLALETLGRFQPSILKELKRLKEGYSKSGEFFETSDMEEQIKSKLEMEIKELK